MKGSVLTSRLTGIATLGFEALGAEMLIWPVHVARPSNRCVYLHA